MDAIKSLLTLYPISNRCVDYKYCTIFKVPAKKTVFEVPVTETEKVNAYMTKMNRRQFLYASALTTIGWFGIPLSNSWGMVSKKHHLCFFHTHTEESLIIPYSPGKLRPSAQKALNMFLRDFRTGDIHPIDPGLLNILYSIQLVAGSQGTIEVISGYRSKQTNRSLRRKSRGVAKKSFHMKGQAIDIRITDLATKKVRNIAGDLGLGGVGYYAKSDFIHLDTGPFRTW